MFVFVFVFIVAVQGRLGRLFAVNVELVRFGIVVILWTGGDCVRHFSRSV